MSLPRPARLPRLTVARLGAVFCLVVACKLCLMNACSSPLPFFDQWEGEGQKLLLPWLEGRLRVSDLFAPHSQHRILWTRLMVLGLFQLNGQWDAQVEMIAAALLHAGCAVAFGVILIRRLGSAWENAILLCLLPLFCLPFDWEDTLSGGFQSQYYFLILSSILTVWGLGTHRAWTSRWWLGVLGALFSWVSVASGPLATVAVAGWVTLRRIRPRDGGGGDSRSDWTTVAVAVVLAAAGFSLSLGLKTPDGLQPASLAGFASVLAGLLSWPCQEPIYAPIAFLPFGVLLWRRFRARSVPSDGTDRVEDFVVPLGFWVILQGAALAYARNRYFGNPMLVSRYMVVLSPGVLVNFVSLLTLCGGRTGGAVAEFPGRRSRLPLGWGLGAAWAAFMLFQVGLLTGRTIELQLPQVKTNNEHQRENLAAYVASGNPAIFRGKSSLDIQSDQPALVARLLRLPAIQRILPACARLPLGLEAVENRHFTTVFKPPTVEGGASEAVWAAQPEAGQTAHFRSQSITRCAPYLEFAIHGRVGTRDACIGLINEGGGENVWLMPGTRVGADGWQRVLVKTPSVPFHVEAFSNSEPDNQVVFLNPREVAPLSALAMSLLDHGVSLVFAGLALWAGLAGWEKFRNAGRRDSRFTGAGAGLGESFPIHELAAGPTRAKAAGDPSPAGF